MVKSDIAPSGLLMARLTVSSGIIFQLNNPLVYIIVAIPAIYPYAPETPFFLFPVAFRTGGCLVRPVQRKTSQVMLFNIVRECIKSVDGMALNAIGRYSVLFKLSLVVVGMTVGAAIMCQGIGELCFMTGIACYI
jgi:hypothetical protein